MYFQSRWMQTTANGYEACMARSLWTGTISFGLVSVPVRMFSATQSKELRESVEKTQRTRKAKPKKRVRAKEAS